MDKNKNKGFSTRKLTICAMLAALGVVILYLGSLVEILDISIAVFASVLCIIAVIEYGGGAPWMIYAITAILSLILIPNKTPAYLYTVFFGFYPILKEKLEKAKKVISWVLKELIFNICLAILICVALFLFTTEDNILRNPLYIAAIVVLSEGVFILYDIALTRLISFYMYNLRKRLRFKK